MLIVYINFVQTLCWGHTKMVALLHQSRIHSIHSIAQWYSAGFECGRSRVQSPAKYHLLDSLVVECWLRVREVLGSIPSQGPRHTKDVIKMVPVVPLFSTEHSKGKILALSQELRQKNNVMDKIWDIKSYEVGGHWPLWWGWKNQMTTQNRQKSNAKNIFLKRDPALSAKWLMQCWY